MNRPRSATPVSPARRCAYTVLRRVFEQGAYADRALHAEAAQLDPRSRALATRLAYGAVQRRLTSDHLIELLAERPVARLDAPVLAALRLGLYELLYLGGSPDHAVVSDAVELSKRAGRPGHALVNGVLRRAAREGRSALLGRLGEETPARAAIMHSHPEWIARLWWHALGPVPARALMARDNEPSELALRANTLRGDPGELAAALPVRARRDPLVPEALVLEQPFDLHSSPLWRAGALIAQSRAAMLAGRALAPQPGERVLDLCAAPGGKTTHLAALMRGEGSIVAVERHAGRADALARTARRLGACNVSVELADAAEWPAREGTRGTFDRVLVDPPCSGLGTLQARADLRWRASSSAVHELASQQAAILDAGAAALRPGGVLVYSTCTISPTENERQIDAFLASHPDFGLDDLAAEVPSLRAPGDSVSARASLLTLPHRDRTAGFFIARLRRV